MSKDYIRENGHSPANFTELRGGGDKAKKCCVPPRAPPPHTVRKWPGGDVWTSRRAPGTDKKKIVHVTL